MKFLFDFWTVDRKKDRTTLLAGLRARSSQRDRPSKRLRDLAGPTRKEKGCVCIVGRRSQFDPDLFTAYQIWEGEEFPEVQARHLQAFCIEAPKLLEDRVLATRRRVGE